MKSTVAFFALTFLIVTSLANARVTTSFNDSGFISQALGYTYNGIITSMVADGDKIIVAGVANYHGFDEERLALARYDHNGKLDSSFGVDGYSIAHVGLFKPQIFLTKDSLLVFGYSGNQYGIVRFNRRGEVESQLSLAGVSNGVLPYTAKGYVQLASGKYVGGIMESGSSGMLSLRGFLPDGNSDTAFGNNGLVQALLPWKDAQLISLQVTPNSKILVTFTHYRQEPTIGVARFLSNGALDTSYGEQGYATIALAEPVIDVSATTVDGDGKWLATGSLLGTNRQYATNDMYVVRLTGDGKSDPLFASNGVFMLPKIPMSQGRSVDLLADGKIQLAGREYTFAQTWPAVVVRLNPNGTLDGTFGTQGVQELPSLPFGGGFFTASYLTSKQEYYCASLGSFGPVLARIRVDGTLDATQ